MMPYRGLPFSKFGNDKKSKPAGTQGTPPSQPTAPSFHIPEQQPTATTPATPAEQLPAMTSPPTTTSPSTPCIPEAASVPGYVPAINQMPSMTTIPQMPQIPAMPQMSQMPTMYQTPVMPQTPQMTSMPQMSTLPCMQPAPYIQPTCPYMCSQMMPDMYDMDYVGIDEDIGMLSPLSAADPSPVLSNNPAVGTFTLFKELTGYPNYGNPSRNSDILYTGNRGSWSFDIPSYLFVPGNLRAQIFIRAVLDDHASVPINRYSARITVNGTTVHTGPVPLDHGTPAGSAFNNWRLLTFNVPNLRRTTRVVIENTSTTGPEDWIALDWLELRLLTR